MVSTKYPAYHKRKGEPTYFPEKIKELLSESKECTNCIVCSSESCLHRKKILQNKNYIKPNYPDKLHTIRSNYPLWEKRIKEILEGKAILSIRYHSLGRYVKGNKQIEICKLNKDSGIGIQKLEFWYNLTNNAQVDDRLYPTISELSKNDGLNIIDFKEWFKPYDLSEPMAVIWFVDKRY
jgi:hypothetical protein